MKQNDLTKGVLAALLLAGPAVGGATAYPPDFKPVIIYQDAELIKQHSQPVMPVAPVEQAKPSAAESKYPEFEPVILYQDAEAIAKTSESRGGVAATGQAGSYAAETGSAAVQSKSENPLTENYLAGLIFLALGGFVVWNMRRTGVAVPQMQAAPAGAAPVAAVEPAPVGETGVARYLRTLPAAVIAKESGVARYLKSLPAPAVAKAAETGVAKYLKTVPAAPKASGETGVAKYLKTLSA